MNTSNSTSAASTSSSNNVNPVVAYLNIVPIIFGVIGNTASFLIFRFHPAFREMPTMVFLSFVAVSDTIALFEWNLEHFTQLVFNVTISNSNLIYCKLFTFAQYASLQTSALTLSVMCIDRYVTVMAMPGSFLHRLPFRTNRSAFIWSCGVICFTILLNLHITIFSGRVLLIIFLNFLLIKIKKSIY